MSNYRGDYLPGQKVFVPWSTNDRSGASIARGTKGQVSVIRASTNTQTTTGVSDVEAPLGLVGCDSTAIDTSASFYAPYDDYLVVLNAATIDGEQVNAIVGSFSILNRSNSRLTVAATVDATNFAPTTTELEFGDITTAEGDNNNLAGRSLYGSIGSNLIKCLGVIESSDAVGGKIHITIPDGDPLPAIPANGSRWVIV